MLVCFHLPQSAMLSNRKAYLNLVCTAWAAFAICASCAAQEPVRFDTQVMAVLSRAGCNSGACHGNLNGKNGFKLSLRGQDPAADFLALSRDMLGRRTNIERPDQSLLLMKATASVPHEGGRRFRADSLEYQILTQWIASGMRRDPAGLPTPVALLVTPMERVVLNPAERVRLQVTARFSDGSSRDVTRLAAFDLSTTLLTLSPDAEVKSEQPGETTILVRYLNLRKAITLTYVTPHVDLPWPSLPATNFVDQFVFQKLKSLHLTPSILCDDGVYVRRAYLDLLGVLPSIAETKTFLADQTSNKRSQLIDSLLKRPEFADFWALKWSDILHNEEKALDRKGVEVFHDWIRQSIQHGKPLNEFAREVVAGRGSTYAQPASSFYRALREPAERAEAAAQVFLGVRLQCARCHNHPYDQWTQHDYHSWTAFFTRVQYRIIENNRRDRLDKHEFDGEQIVWQDRTSEWKDPRTNTNLAPKFLGEETQNFGKEDDRLLVLADWIARPENPYFARAQANRIWSHLMGRGLVEPNDDFRASNPPTNPGLLDALAGDLAEHQFDLRHLIRTIMTSTAYQLSAAPNATNRDDDTNFSHALVRSLPAEVLFDALGQASGARARLRGVPAETRATQLAGVQTRGDRKASSADQFLQRFGKPERLLSCDCERSDDVTLSQAFQLITGETINKAATQGGRRLSDRLRTGYSLHSLVDDCYLAALSRYPTANERTAIEAMLLVPGKQREALEDLLAALLSSKEFLLRH
ncbi:DUF1549 domain-containing protein [soil metagenome]